MTQWPEHCVFLHPSMSSINQWSLFMWTIFSCWCIIGPIYAQQKTMLVQCYSIIAPMLSCWYNVKTMVYLHCESTGLGAFFSQFNQRKLYSMTNGRQPHFSQLCSTETTYVTLNSKVNFVLRTWEQELKKKAKKYQKQPYLSLILRSLHYQEKWMVN